MVTEEFFKNNPNVNITVSATDLQKVFDYAISRTRSEFGESKNETYYTIAETAKELKVSKPTLWRWCKSGYLVPITVGGKRRYKTSDIQKLLTKSN